jgi:CheY-like chemotaxis protein
LVDDDPATNYLHTRAIKGADCTEEVVVVENGEDALAYLQKRFDGGKSAPELILLDINMPVMNGWEFLTTYSQLDAERKRGTRIVMLTTSTNPDDEQRSLTYEAVKGFNFKPLDKEMLALLLQQHFAELL